MVRVRVMVSVRVRVRDRVRVRVWVFESPAHIPRRKGVRTVQNWSICWGVKDCLHREREMREIFRSERCQTHEGGAGEGDLFESAWRSTGTAQQYPRLPHKVQPQRAKKVVWRGLVREIQKRKTRPFFF